MPASPVLTAREVSKRFVTRAQRATQLEERVVAGRRGGRRSELWALRDVDADEGMVRIARAAGHDVQLADALSGLRERPDASVQGVFSAQQSYAQLLAQLSPPNEVPVVARAV